MKSEELLILEFRKRGKTVGAELVLDTPTALEFVAACQSKDLAVIGIEGFILESGSLQPQLNMIADYSSEQKSPWLQFRDECNRSAEQFLKTITPKPGLVFSFVVKGNT